MHPAPSIILFTTASGIGLALLAMLGFGLIPARGFAAFLWFAMAYTITLGGLVSSTFHLEHPERALLAFTQWRSSWLSREAVLAAMTLVAAAPLALARIFWHMPLPIFGAMVGLLALATILATAMIYAQLRAVPRWRHWSTPFVFFASALTGAILVTGDAMLAQIALAWFALALMLHWRFGDRAFARAGASMNSATGIDKGQIRLLEAPHTNRNYLMREMVFVLARKHAIKLRAFALVLGCFAPALILWLLPFTALGTVLALTLHFAGALTARWLFFAEAEHTVGLYYGAR